MQYRISRARIFLFFTYFIVIAVAAVLPILFKVTFFYYASYYVLYFIILSEAWNIFGGYCGYVNFGVAGFAGAAAYTDAYLIKIGVANFTTALFCGALVAVFLGLLLGYCTLRLRGDYFSIASVALATIVQMIIISRPELGGGLGFVIPMPEPPQPYTTFVEFLFVVMVVIASTSVLISWKVAKSWIGMGLVAIKDDEIAAETLGVPTFRLKLLAAIISALFIGLAGATLPSYVIYLDPYSSMAIEVTVTTLASAYLGGLGFWYGPLVGASILGTASRVCTLTIGSEFNVLVIGIILVVTIMIAPSGIVGAIKKRVKEGNR